MTKFKIIVLTTILACIPAAGAAIPVTNFSFEVPDLGHNTSATERFTQGVPIMGWTGTTMSNQAFGVADPSNTQFSGTDTATLPATGDGAQYGYLNLAAGNSASFTYSGATLGTFQQGQLYRLTVAVGGRRDGGLPASSSVIELLANGVPVAMQSCAAMADTFRDLTLNFTAGAGLAGQSIGIVLMAANTSNGFEQGIFDNVRLEAVPEPATFTFISLGLVGIMAGAWRRKKSA
jgi:hypothetical protein